MVKKIGTGWCVLCLGSLLLAGCTSGPTRPAATTRGPGGMPTATNTPRPGAFGTNTPGSNNVIVSDPPAPGNPYGPAPVVGASSNQRTTSPYAAPGIPNAPIQPNPNLPPGPYNNGPNLTPEQLSPAGLQPGLQPTPTPGLRPQNFPAPQPFPTPPTMR